jgi:hypothetical protein
MGWVSNGVAYLRVNALICNFKYYFKYYFKFSKKDAYNARKPFGPDSDTKQDFVLLGGAELNGYTILKFKRKYVTNEPIVDVDIVVSFNECFILSIN